MADKSPKEIGENCAHGVDCSCATKVLVGARVKYWQCANWGRSSLGAPTIVGRDPAYKSAPNAWGGVSPKYRQEMKEAGEIAMLNNRPFTGTQLPTDRSAKDIRKEAKERARQRKQRV